MSSGCRVKRAALAMKKQISGLTSSFAAVRAFLNASNTAIT